MLRSPVCTAQSGHALICIKKANNRAHRQRPVNMREKRTAARFFPDDGLTQLGQVHLGDHKAVLSGKMLVERALQLIGRRQMNIAIGQINRRPVKDAFGFKLRPLCGGEYFEGGIGMAMFGHTPPMPKSRGRRKPRMGMSAPPRAGYADTFLTITAT